MPPVNLFPWPLESSRFPSNSQSPKFPTTPMLGIGVPTGTTLENHRRNAGRAAHFQGVLRVHDIPLRPDQYIAADKTDLRAVVIDDIQSAEHNTRRDRAAPYAFE